MQNPKPGLFRQTPPAIFPPIFGLFGLGLAWRRAADGFPVPAAIGEVILGAVALLYLLTLLAYVAKFIKRPAVLGEDLQTLPGRAGLAAMTMSGMLLAAAIVIYSRSLAQVCLSLAVAGHLVIALLVLRNLIKGPAEARAVTPVWHLVFVGFIISPLAALPLGWQGYALMVFAATLALALAIWGLSLWQMVRKSTPPPLRPTLAIHLAPASVLGIVAYLLGYPGLGLTLAAVSVVMLFAMILRGRWLTAAGFGPLWGAFTFPLAAFSNLMQIVAATGGGEMFRVLGGLSLVAATLIIPVITWKVLKMWIKGVLAAKTNAAIA